MAVHVCTLYNPTSRPSTNSVTPVQCWATLPRSRGAKRTQPFPSMKRLASPALPLPKSLDHAMDRPVPVRRAVADVADGLQCPARNLGRGPLRAPVQHAHQDGGPAALGALDIIAAQLLPLRVQ